MAVKANTSDENSRQCKRHNLNNVNVTKTIHTQNLLLTQKDNI